MCVAHGKVVKIIILSQDTQSPHKITLNFLGMTHKMNTRKILVFFFFNLAQLRDYRSIIFYDLFLGLNMLTFAPCITSETGAADVV